MYRKTLICLSLAALGLSLWLPCQAGAPVKISEVAPVKEFVDEANAKIKEIEDVLVDENAYKQARNTTLPNLSGVLTILAQAIAESDEASEWKATAADVRDAAIAIANSKSYDEAKKGLEAVKAAKGGKGNGAKVDYEWNKLAKLGSLMRSVSKPQGKIRQAVRPTSKANPADAAPAASLIALIAVAAHDDLHETKGEDQQKMWKEYMKEMQVQMSATAKALRSGDRAAADAAFKKAGTTCADCHNNIRDKNK